MPSKPPVLPLRRSRDVVLLDLDAGMVLLVACDSIGSIGPKPHDAYPATAETVGHFAVRVPLLEVLCAGGSPQLVVDTLSVEMEPTGAAMIEEVRRVAAEVGLGPERVTGSTEDNVATLATGVGVTVIAAAEPAQLRPGGGREGDRLFCLGRPTSAPDDDVVIGDRRMISLRDLARVLEDHDVHDAVPVGSRGVAYEVGELAASAGLVPDLRRDAPFDLDKSGGPASCVVIAVDDDAVGPLLDSLRADLPTADLGRLIGRAHG